MKTSFPVSELIRRDHREMERLFDELTEVEKRPLVAPTLLALLGAHSRAEESEVYPVLRKETDAAEDVAHSQQEHAEADALVSSLVHGDLDGDKYDRTLKRLVETVSHHIEEEESDVLPKLEELPRTQQLELGSSFANARAEILCSGADALTREQLEQQARNERLSGISGMDKRELSRAVAQD